MLDIIPYAVGGAVGGLVVAVIFVLVLVLTVALLVRRNKDEPDSARRRGGRAQNFSTAYIELRANESYIPIFRQISTRDNIAYGEVGNSEIVNSSIKASTTNIDHEYEYVV